MVILKNYFEVKGDVTFIHIDYKKDTYICLIDTEDLYKMNTLPGKWYGWKDKQNGIYVVSNYPDNSRYLHRFLLGYQGDKDIDHINNNPLDNRKENLRIINREMNSFNRKGANKNNIHSGVRNVYWNKNRKKYHVEVTFRRKKYFGGRFDSLDDAKEAAEILRNKIKKSG